ncbi:DUF2796 domain-containing protein [Ideonella sp.]|uniref:DUF2796 domain-containing protein n=1 Tax=Ideonella sp. TaxID=1929293 RepID=UPI003BB6B346
MIRSSAALLLCTCALAAGPALAAGKAHEHGALKLDIALDGSTLSIDMEAPLDNLLGFERAPRTDAERKAAAEVLARLRSLDKTNPLFVPDAAAQCALVKAEVEAPVLESTKPLAKDDHADVDATYTYTCAQPLALKRLEVRLFDAYKRIARIDVQVAGAKGQSKATLKRPARDVVLAP